LPLLLVAGGGADVAAQIRDAGFMRRFKVRTTRSQAVQQLVDALLALSANRDAANVRCDSDTSSAFEASRFTVKTLKRSAA
jgi:hypothetical protein